MLHNKRILLLVAIVMILATVLSGCAKGQALSKEINLNHGTEPPTIDPNLATDSTSVQCVELLFMGLTEFDDKTVETIPSLATEWKVSEDGLKWTFKMRKDVQFVQYDPATKKTTKKGPVTAKDVITVLPFGNDVVKVTLTGAQVQQMLDSSASRTGGDGGFLQVSGVRFRIAGGKAQDVLVGGQPLVPGNLYTLATSDFLFTGGDGYTVFAQGQAPYPYGVRLSDVVIEALRGMGTIKAEVDGRIARQ